MPLSPSSTRINTLLRCLDENRGELLQYDAAQQRLVLQYTHGMLSIISWYNLIYWWKSCPYRPLNESLVPVHVDDFVAHHISYSFPYPTCFCPVLLGSAEDIQSLIHISPRESIEKRVIATCAKGACGYFGTHTQCWLALAWSWSSVFAVNMICRPGSLVQYYPLRGSGRHYAKSEPYWPRMSSIQK